MKLLFDQNLSPRLPRLLAMEFPGSAHVREFGLARSGDSILWAHAATECFAITSKDIDFQQRALLRGHPPKVVWIRLGNCLTAAIEALLRSNHAILLRFEADPTASFIALG